MRKNFTKTFAKYLPLIVAVLMVAAPSFAVIVGSLPYTLTNGSTADATQVMANYNKIIADVNANAAKNGVNSDITAITGLTTPLSAAQGGANVWYGTSASTGTANAQSVATLVPNNFTLVTGNTVSFIAGFTNTGATTLNANGTGATNVFKRTLAGTTALAGGEIVSGAVTVVRYDGTQWQLVSDIDSGFGVQTNLASAGTTDLGTIASHNVNITGTTTITSFGSSASTTYPIYKIKFAGALTLTYNATSLILPGAANYTTQAGDTADVEYLGSGNWRVRDFNHKGGLARVDFYTANSTWTLAAGERTVWFKCVGGGGAGGGAATSISAGAGGGAGGYAEKYVTSPASSYTITIGAAGVGAANATGGNGGNTTVGAILTCNGGSGGATAAAVGNRAAGGAGGTASSGDLNITGNKGGDSINIDGVGGADGALAGDGGNAAFAGNGGRGPTSIGTTNVAGNAGQTCGGGGSGAAGGTGSTQAGGDGGVGCVIAYTFY